MSPNHFHHPLIPLMGIVTTIIVQHPITLAESTQEDLATMAQATTVIIKAQNQGSGVNNESRPYWSKAPRLIDSGTTQNGLRVYGATYYFTVSIPEDAGAPLQQLTFAQTEWADFWETYNIEETKAFEGTRKKRGAQVPLGMVSIDDQNETVTVTFSPPLAPGKTVTVGLRPYYTPSHGGVYLFRITAFPPGGASQSLTLGVARFHFYDPR